MYGYFTKFNKSKFPFTSLHKFHTNRHPSLAKSGQKRHRFTEQSASWKLNDMNMNKLQDLKMKNNMIFNSASLQAYTLLSAITSDCQFILRQTCHRKLNNQTKLQFYQNKSPEFSQIIKTTYIK
jgi:hypothetical protein